MRLRTIEEYRDAGTFEILFRTDHDITEWTEEEWRQIEALEREPNRVIQSRLIIEVLNNWGECISRAVDDWTQHKPYPPDTFNYPSNSWELGYPRIWTK